MSGTYSYPDLGRHVRYHGSKPNYHGIYIFSGECHCNERFCLMALEPRFQLASLDGRAEDGLIHVRRESFTFLESREPAQP